MMERTKMTMAAGVAALALAAAGTGIAFAQPSDPTPSPTPTPSGSPEPRGARHGHGGHGGHDGFGNNGLLGKIEHGEATVDTGNNGTQVIDIQRGTVSSAGPRTLTVNSTDGFSATYTVDSSTKIRKNRATSDISQVATNDRVTVIAIKSGDTVTAQRINDIGPAK